ncbi:MAG: BrnA antitoxin family protein [Gemmatimonadota bacterium]|nr:BrnA antitoxin family protein [Gemmatimonadota bacterium]
MSDENIVRRTLQDRRRGQTDWARVAALTDAEIEQAIAEDPDAAPLLDEEFFRTARLVMPEDRRKVPVSLRLDPQVVEFFKRQGRGYQSRINAVLKAYVRSQERRG